ncbi:Nitrogen permease regulator 2 [Coemansia sp. Benny D115]|nr:Nitrogen permease regulator 2 [Coemansia sp. Benny D115]
MTGHIDESGFPDIKAIFLAQFHPHQGPMVRLSYPEDAVEVGDKKGFGETSNSKTNLHQQGLSKSASGVNLSGRTFTSESGVEMVQLIRRPQQTRPQSDKIDFNSIQALVIPKVTLFERLITVNTGKYKVMCYPIAVEGNYARNALIFNMCFAFSIDADTRCYGPVVKRVGCLLKELEISGRLLSDPEGGQPLRVMMRQLVNKLNAHGEYQIELDLKGLSQSLASTGISIKLFPYYENPKEIMAYHVPVRTVDFELARLKSSMTVYQSQISGDILWDLVLDRVIQLMDNVNHVKRIAHLAGIRVDTVVVALKHLEYYGCINLVDIFQFSNVYEPRYPLMGLYANSWLQHECFRYVTRDRKVGGVQMEDLIRMYASMGGRRTVGDWILEEGLDIERFDVRRFVLFGLMHGLIRRVHCYPILCGQPRGEGDKTLDPRVLSLLDGTHHMDEISVEEGVDARTLRGSLDEYGGVEYVYL